MITVTVWHCDRPRASPGPGPTPSPTRDTVRVLAGPGGRGPGPPTQAGQAAASVRSDPELRTAA
eukprot:384355-Hanusia_phi.AAC.1